jgi:uncharacterized protein YndB with AHSA1/START domain
LAVTIVPARAEVLHAAGNGFELQHEVVIEADRASVWQAAVHEIGRWWHDGHTISGDAGRLSIDAVPLGCFCEDLGEGDGVVHLTVTTVQKNASLRLTGGLGPLGVIGVNGNMLWDFFDDDEGTRVRFTYAVGGYYRDGLDQYAGPVDYVIGEALARLAAYAEGHDPDDVALE